MPLDPPVVRQSNLSDLLFSSHNDVFHMKFIYACGVPKVSLEDEKQESSPFTLSLFDHVLLHVLSLTVFVLFFFFQISPDTFSFTAFFSHLFFLTVCFSSHVLPHIFSLTTFFFTEFLLTIFHLVVLFLICISLCYVLSHNFLLRIFSLYIIRH